MIGVGTTIFLVNPTTFGGDTYLLDDYSAAAAYSLRQLKTGVTNVVRVRRSSDSAESDFTATEITDGTLTTWTGANDGFIVKFYEQYSGIAIRDIVQSTAANQPKLVSSGTVLTENGKPCATFDGTNDEIRVPAVNGHRPFGTNFSQFVVTTIPSNANSYMVFGSLAGGGAALIANFVGSSVEHFVGGGDREDYLASSTAGQQKLFELNVTDATSLKTYTNGSNTASITPATTYNAGGFWGIGSSGAGSYSDINFQEYILFDIDESANRTAIESDINTYYSIY
jgi:hypothetical protein